MRFLKSASLTLMMILTLAACGGPATEQPAQPAADPVAVNVAPEPLPIIEVSAEGTELDPAVQVEQIPDGAWYCDMGTVHYARAEQGDGSCPICGMDLVQKQAAVTEESEELTPEAEQAHEDHGHDHQA